MDCPGARTKGNKIQQYACRTGVKVEQGVWKDGAITRNGVNKVQRYTCVLFTFLIAFTKYLTKTRLKEGTVCCGS